MSETAHKKTDAPVIREIIIRKSNAELTDPCYTASDAPSSGYGDVYELRHPDGSPAGRHNKACSGDVISFRCNQPFTFLAAERDYWQSPQITVPLTWKQLLLADGHAFAALNSNTTATTGPLGFRLDLVIVKNSSCVQPPGYTITIPQLDLPPWPTYKMMSQAPPPPNPTFVRATVILQ